MQASTRDPGCKGDNRTGHLVSAGTQHTLWPQTQRPMAPSSTLWFPPHGGHCTSCPHSTRPRASLPPALFLPGLESPPLSREPEDPLPVHKDTLTTDLGPSASPFYRLLCLQPVSLQRRAKCSAILPASEHAHSLGTPYKGCSPGVLLPVDVHGVPHLILPSTEPPKHGGGLRPGLMG